MYTYFYTVTFENSRYDAKINDFLLLHNHNQQDEIKVKQILSVEFF